MHTKWNNNPPFKTMWRYWLYVLCSSTVLSMATILVSTHGLYTRILHMASTPGHYIQPLHLASTPDFYTRPLQPSTTPGLYTRPLHLASTPGLYSWFLRPPPTSGLWILLYMLCIDRLWQSLCVTSNTTVSRRNSCKCFWDTSSKIYMTIRGRRLHSHCSRWGSGVRIDLGGISCWNIPPLTNVAGGTRGPSQGW